MEINKIRKPGAINRISNSSSGPGTDALTADWALKVCRAQTQFDTLINGNK